MTGPSSSPLPELKRAHLGVASGWRRWLPGLAMLRDYQRGWLVDDLVAGLVLSALLVPAGMAYAQASGLPAVTGLYATVLPLLAYALFGPSRVLVFGPDSALSPLIAAVVVPVVASNPGQAIALAGMVALLTGALCVLAGLARFGFLSELLSAPVRYGYLNGIALTVLVSQLPKLLGLHVTGGSVLDSATGVVGEISAGRTNLWALGLGAIALAVILGAQRFAPRLPGTLLALGGAVLAVHGLNLEQHALALVGALPGGLPVPAWPGVGLDDLPRLFGVAVGVAFVAFTDTSVLSRSIALRTRREVDANQELIALGLVNLASGLFGGFAVSSSQTRTPVAESAGARSQLTGVVAAAAVVLFITVAPNAFRALPEAALAAVVIAAALRLVEFRSVTRLARLRPSEFALSLVAFACVAALGPLRGIGIAVTLSLLNFMRQAWRPHATELVRVDGLKGYHDAERHPEGRTIPGLMLYRFDAPLFFANASHFVADVVRRVDAAKAPVRRVVVTAEPITDVDSTAADSLRQLMTELEARGAGLAFAELKGHVRERLQGFGVLEQVGAAHLHRTVGEAVHSYVSETGVVWVDWQDRPGAEGGASPPSTRD